MSRRVPALRRLLIAAVAGGLAVGLSATAAHAAADAPGSYRSVTTTSAQNTWVPGVLSSARDVDVYRFTTTASRHARILLGDLVADYRMRLIDAGGRTVATSDRANRANEEIYLALRAGTYFVAVDAPKGAVSASPYVVRFTSLPEGVLLLSKAEYGTGTNRELVFEVLNNTSRTIDGAGFHLTGPEKCGDNPFVTCQQLNVMMGTTRIIPPRARQSFYTDAIQGEDVYTFKLLPGSPIAFTSKMSGTVTKTTPVTGGVRITGTLTNRSTHYACAPMVVRSAYDDRGGLISQFEQWWSGTLGAGRTMNWTISKAHVPPPGTTRVAWNVSERGPDVAC